jgi:hypothetical protein
LARAATADCIRFARWINSEAGDADIREDGFEALVLNLDGTIDWFGKDLEPLRYFAPMTIGSGGAMALGAMLAGKSPKQAVEIACQRDIKSGGDIVEISLVSEPKLEAVA